MDNETVIEHVDVYFEVDGDDNDVFSRMFRQHIQAWARAQRQREREVERSRRERSVASGQRRWGGGG
jgi:hypothetical protein